MMISFRLNPEIDAEIVTHLQRIPKRDRSRALREALRMFFGGSRSIESQKIDQPLKLDLRLSEDDLQGEERDPDEKLDQMLSFFE